MAADYVLDPKLRERAEAELTALFARKYPLLSAEYHASSVHRVLRNAWLAATTAHESRFSPEFKKEAPYASSRELSSHLSEQARSAIEQSRQRRQAVIERAQSLYEGMHRDLLIAFFSAGELALSTSLAEEIVDKCILVHK